MSVPVENEEVGGLRSKALHQLRASLCFPLIVEAPSRSLRGHVMKSQIDLANEEGS